MHIILPDEHTSYTWEFELAFNMELFFVFLLERL